ncbi:MAG: 3-phosphoserine/phosphohydroxythreonine transaminase [Sediminibacterium sp.]|jgi:phosphoserine aminotransferase|nr:3-phosphoserine/phosphohydroxythreonine transaminase [Sediminibacterium sp.]
MQLHNFNSGPSILPTVVLEQAAAAIHNFNNTGLSILEIGHRTSHFVEVVTEAQQIIKRLMGLDDAYEVLFLQGGATMQFMQVPMNLLDENGLAAICDNGVWGNKAVKEASIFGPVKVVSDTSDKKHTYLNKQLDIPANTTYLHITTNNTVEGTQWHQYPQTNTLLVGDMSSDIFCRPTAFNQFDLIYAGAQKNMGAAGVTIVVVKKEILGKVNRKIPAILDYKKHIEAGSLLNTPPVFSIYVTLLTLRWMEAQGGLVEMGKRNNAKAQLLYDTIDSLPAFQCPIAKEDRSIMNAVFFLTDSTRESAFLDLCKKEGMIGVKGYRTVGGIRVSMYNAMPIASVQTFCDLMKSFG